MDTATANHIRDLIRTDQAANGGTEAGSAALDLLYEHGILTDQEDGSTTIREELLSELSQGEELIEDAIRGLAGHGLDEEQEDFLEESGIKHRGSEPPHRNKN